MIRALCGIKFIVLMQFSKPTFSRNCKTLNTDFYYLKKLIQPFWHLLDTNISFIKISSFFYLRNLQKKTPVCLANLSVIFKDIFAYLKIESVMMISIFFCCLARLYVKYSISFYNILTEIYAKRLFFWKKVERALFMLLSAQQKQNN